MVNLLRVTTLSHHPGPLSRAHRAEEPASSARGLEALADASGRELRSEHTALENLRRETDSASAAAEAARRRGDAARRQLDAVEEELAHLRAEARASSARVSARSGALDERTRALAEARASRLRVDAELCARRATCSAAMDVVHERLREIRQLFIEHDAFAEELAEDSPHPADTLAASLPVEVRDAVVDANLRLRAVEEKLRRELTPTGAGTSG